MEAENILPDDIKNVLRDAATFKQKLYQTRTTNHELEETTKLLTQEVARSREGEEKQRAAAVKITEDLKQLQISVTDLVAIKQENIVLKDQVKEYETKIRELNENLEKERLSCHELTQKRQRECEEQAATDLMYAHAQADNLREELASAEENLQVSTAELQAKLRHAETSRNDEISQLTYEFQEKVNNLQSALTATQAENRNLRDRLQFNTATYQKKIQDLERRSAVHPALRTPASSKGGKSLPKLQFLASDQPEEAIDSTETAQPENTAGNKRRRKLFTHKNPIE